MSETQHETQNTTEQATEQQNTADTGAAAGNVQPSHEELQERVADLTAQLKDQELRTLANEQNLRRRHQEELLAAHKFAGQKMATAMLPVKDYLEMALSDQSENFEALKIGVQMTLNELQKAFETAQIKEINPQPGDKLDPHRHQAMQTEAGEQEPHTVIRVLKKGYSLSERILRPAMVVVSALPVVETAQEQETA